MNSKTCCPSCEIVFKVTEEQLTVADGWARCGRCDTVFNALENMQSEAMLEENPSASKSESGTPANHANDSITDNLKPPVAATIEDKGNKPVVKKQNEPRSNIDLVDQWSKQRQLKEDMFLDSDSETIASEKVNTHQKPNATKPIVAIKSASNKAAQLINRWRKSKDTTKSWANVEAIADTEQLDNQAQRVTSSVDAGIDKTTDEKATVVAQTPVENTSKDANNGPSGPAKALEKSTDIAFEKEDEPISSQKVEHIAEQPDLNEKTAKTEVLIDPASVKADNAFLKTTTALKTEVEVASETEASSKLPAEPKRKLDVEKQSKPNAKPVESQLSIFDIDTNQKEKQKDLFNDSTRLIKPAPIKTTMLTFIESDDDGIDEEQNNNSFAQEKLAQEKLAQEKLAQEKLAQEKQAQEKLAQEKLAQEKLAQEKQAQEKLAQEKLAQEKLAQEKLAQEKLTQEKLTQEKQAQEKLVLDKEQSIDYILLGDDDVEEDDKIAALPNKTNASNLNFSNNKKNVKGLVIKNSNRHLWKHKTSLFKKVCLVIAVAVLLLQLIFGLVGKDEVSNASEQEALPWWCSILDCESAMLSKGPNISSNDVVVRNVSLRKNELIPSAWVLRLSLYNQSEIEQVLPKLKLVFHSEDNNILGSRIIDLKDHPEVIKDQKTYETLVSEQVLPLEMVFQSLPWETFGYDVYLLQ